MVGNQDNWTLVVVLGRHFPSKVHVDLDFVPTVGLEALGRRCVDCGFVVHSVAGTRLEPVVRS